MGIAHEGLKAPRRRALRIGSANDAAQAAISAKPCTASFADWCSAILAGAKPHDWLAEPLTPVATCFVSGAVFAGSQRYVVAETIQAAIDALTKHGGGAP